MNVSQQDDDMELYKPTTYYTSNSQTYPHESHNNSLLGIPTLTSLLARYLMKQQDSY